MGFAMWMSLGTDADVSARSGWRIEEGFDVAVQGLVKGATLIIPGAGRAETSSAHLRAIAVELDLGDVAERVLRPAIAQIPVVLKVDINFVPRQRWVARDGVDGLVRSVDGISVGALKDPSDHTRRMEQPRIKPDLIVGGRPGAGTDADVSARSGWRIEEGFEVSIEGLVKSAALTAPGTWRAETLFGQLYSVAIELDFSDVAEGIDRPAIAQIPIVLEVHLNFVPRERGVVRDGVDGLVRSVDGIAVGALKDPSDHTRRMEQPRIKPDLIVGGRPGAGTDADVSARSCWRIEEGFDVAVQGLVKGAALIIPGAGRAETSSTHLRAVTIELDFGDVAP